MTRRRRLVLGICATLAALSASVGVFWHAPDLLVWNASTSMPRGLYVRTRATTELGAQVTVRAGDVARDYSRSRGASPDFRLLKRIAAKHGDLVCAMADRLTINGVERARRAPRDRSGRWLPTWSGCLVVGENEVLLLGDTTESFDGRYFGVTSTALIKGAWQPLLIH